VSRMKVGRITFAPGKPEVVVDDLSATYKQMRETAMSRYVREKIRERGGVREVMLTQLRNFASGSDGFEMDQLLALSAFGKGLRAEYDEAVLPIPDWLEESLKAVRTEILSRRRDSLEKALKSAQSRLEALKSADERRADLKSEIEKIQKALA
jgi:hypothetical protein